MAKYSVLIVDDEPGMREGIEFYVTETVGASTIVHAADGVEGLNAAKKQKFDLVITDLNMPNMNGKTMLASLAGLPPEFKPGLCFVMSGHYLETAIVREIGNVTFFPKPISKIEFQDKLRKHLKLDGDAVMPVLTLVDENFINPFIEATVTVLHTIAGIAAKKDKVFVRAEDQIMGDISSLITMNSQTFFGSFAISFQEKGFLDIVEKMLGEKFPTINSDIQDAAAEMCNQIFGVGKKILNERGHSIMPAIPTVIAGPGHTIKHPVGGICLAATLNTDVGPILIEAVAKEKSRLL